ncbi:MAG: tetratricopeptide repeat protein [Planctomycetota bacterium]|nr:MAG: tetratricopeptide repeat protein [Planctomycetota bacterium]
MSRSSGDAIDRGLAAAFGPSGVQPPATSVLQALQARANSALGVHLDSQGLDDAPVKVTEAVKALRDPSGRYQILGEIGRGGVGIVYKGRDSDLGRDVALKVLKDEYADRPDVLARFVEEAQIGGQLQHPGIVPVYELGLHAGERPYFAMKLVKGETLAAQLARRGDPARDRRRLLGIFEQVCQTMAYAHARRVIHRDLKPANVMIGAFGEVQVIDWGFARVLPKGGVADETESLTRASERSVIETVRSAPGSNSVAGSVLGTPAYMSPEQANGDVDHLDRRSDVFGLGAILCEILTGEAPYREADGELVRQAATGALDGALERLRECGADEALVTLCTECLARARRARPESAAEVAERVSAYLTSVEERAREAELRAAEARYRNRTTLICAAAGLVVVMLAAGAWIWNADQAETRRAEAMQRVATAMSAASGARGQAQAAGLDGTLWAAAVSSAEQLLSLTESDDVDGGARAEAESLLGDVQVETRAAETEVQRLERDAAMLARLTTLRIPTEDAVTTPGWDERDSRRLDAEYASAFTEYLGGSSLLEWPSELSLAALRHGDIELELATSLDHWGLVRDSLRDTNGAPDFAGTGRIREIAALLDPYDRWRAQLRTLLPNAAGEGTRLRALAEEAGFESLTAAGCGVLAEALWRAGERDAALVTLRRAQETHPRDFNLCFRLALRLELMDERSWNEASGGYRRTFTPVPEYWEEAVATYRIANALWPEHGAVLHRLGMALEHLGRHGEAERTYRLLLAREPTEPIALHHLGRTLWVQGKYEDAIDAYERALDSDPRQFSTINNLGAVYYAREEYDTASEYFRRALEVDPEHTSSHCNLGNALQGLGKIEDAIECYRTALAIDPAVANIHNCLGNALRVQGEFAAARACYERALELDPDFPSVHFNHGIALRDGGDLEAALESFERAQKLYARLDTPVARKWEASSGTAAQQVRRILALGPALDEVLAGQRAVTSSEEWSGAVAGGYLQRRFQEVVTLTEETLWSAPELVEDSEQGFYTSASAAVLLAAQSTPEPDADERSRMRELAREWLFAELGRCQRWIDEGGESAAEARRRLQQIMGDPDFASVRGDGLEELPAGERAGWEELWSEIGRASGEGGR